MGGHCRAAPWSPRGGPRPSRGISVPLAYCGSARVTILYVFCHGNIWKAVPRGSGSRWRMGESGYLSLGPPLNTLGVPSVLLNSLRHEDQVLSAGLPGNPSAKGNLARLGPYSPCQALQKLLLSSRAPEAIERLSRKAGGMGSALPALWGRTHKESVR